ncbi:MAG TPA: hypothetical protein VGS97_15635 [Actinocrinis sp.]|uniref:hypothetical protein n=1 Tax=Actinocrinis sp. TaxID=1920516 RepID=UPI002DDD2AE5|nr:hypothetical protein [Actinocrinis sp.]HEV2345530.1 hypothetical protein [Actinocrinis sp.]
MAGLEYRAVLDVDIEGSSGRGDVALRVIRERLFDALESSFRLAGIDWEICLRADKGDGMLIVAPPGTAKAALIHPLIPQLAARLRSHNRGAGPGTRIRVRVAMHAGELHLDGEGDVMGGTMEVIARLLDAAPLRSALRAAPPDTPLALIVSRHVYEDTVGHGYPGVVPEDFRKVRVEVKKYGDDAWLYVPGLAVTAQEVTNAAANTGTDAGPLPRQDPTSDTGASAGLHQTIEASGYGTAAGTQYGNTYIGGATGRGRGARMGAEGEIAALAAAGATTLVAAMATDMWRAVRDAVAALFHRADPERGGAVAARLDENAALVSAAPDPRSAREVVRGVWELELAMLLSSAPDTAPDLEALTRWYDRAAGARMPGAMTQTITARESGLAVGAQMGDVHVHPAPTPAPTGADTPSTDR